MGIFVHLVGFTTGIVGPGLIYLLSKDDFTRENARNALNWQLFLIPVFLVMAIGILVAVELSNRVEIPDALELVFAIPVPILLAVMALLSLSTFVLPVIATAKAIIGKAWQYPLAPEFI
ncbi:DUF4870 domain-containing protein [Halorussus pelagicus]|uniref:DUF4870 domain-containing protein n=1 Tax=Halorussus pelagicus TaxID=2505977 RepID=UPI001407E712|nr:DUF4870 domain-containing protein [Halorussus pelagicus]